MSYKVLRMPSPIGLGGSSWIVTLKCVLEVGSSGSRFLIDGRGAVSEYSKGYLYINNDHAVKSGYTGVAMKVNGVSRPFSTYALPRGEVLELEFTFPSASGQYLSRFFCNVGNNEQFKGTVYSIEIDNPTYPARCSYYKISPRFSATKPTETTVVNLIEDSTDGDLIITGAENAWIQQN